MNLCDGDGMCETYVCVCVIPFLVNFQTTIIHGGETSYFESEFSIMNKSTPLLSLVHMVPLIATLLFFENVKGPLRAPEVKE